MLGRISSNTYSLIMDGEKTQAFYAEIVGTKQQIPCDNVMEDDHFVFVSFINNLLLIMNAYPLTSVKRLR